MKRKFLMKSALTLTLVCATITAVFLGTAAINGVETTVSYTDVAESDWFYENVKTAYELGFMNGKAEGAFDPNGNVTVVEGITMAARLHAIYNGTEVTDSAAPVNEHRFDFDDPSILVDLSQRNSINKDGINFKRAKGKIENGILIALSPSGTKA